MNCYFSENEVIRFETGKAFVIKEIIGRGASCVVYRAVSTDSATGNLSNECLLKEYHPSRLALMRKENGDLIAIHENDQKIFQDGMDRFLKGCALQQQFRNDPDYPELRNSTSNIQDIHKGYGTAFIEMTYFNGKSYDKITEKTLADLIRRMIALTKTIASYHKKGYLHLDLKPENIFALPETSEMVMLFDFDSIVAKTDLLKMDTRLSYTPKWAAPELTGSNPFCEVNESTDLYSIGMIFYHKLTGTFPDHNQQRQGKYDLDPKFRLLNKSSKRVFTLLSTFFQNTLCEVKECRWQTADKLIDALNKLLHAANQPRISCSSIIMKGIMISVAICILLSLYSALFRTNQTGSNPTDSIQNTMPTGTTSQTEYGNDTVSTNPDDSVLADGPSNPHDTTDLANVTEPPTYSTEEISPPPAAQQKKLYAIDTIAYTSENFHSLIVTNDGVVYYLDGTEIFHSAGSDSLDMESDFNEPLNTGYLAYDPYHDIVYLLAGGSLAIYDITDFHNPTLIMDGATIQLEYTSAVTPQIAVLPDGSLLVPADLDGTYRVNPTNGHIASFHRIYSLSSPYYAKVVGDYILEWRADSTEATVHPLLGGQEYDIQLIEDGPYDATCSVQDKVLFYSDGVGICEFGIDGEFSVLIPQSHIQVKDYQSLDYTNIWAIAANENGVVAFYDNSLRCIRLISPEQ